MADVKAKLEEARTSIALRKAEIELKHLDRAKRIMESRDVWDHFDYHSPLLRMADRFKEGAGDLFHQFSLASDRKHGDNWPFWRTWQEHSQLRAQARLVTMLTCAGTGILSGLCSFIVGDGFAYRATTEEEGLEDLVSAVDRIIEEFHEANLWNEMEQELFNRSREDGEYFLRYFPQSDGSLLVRVVEPAEVIEPTTFPREIWSYGIKNDPDDIETVEGYFVSYSGDLDDGEEVDADEIDHIKVNVPRRVKRGCTDFCYQAEDLIRVSGRALENMGEATAIQAAIAFIRQHEGQSKESVQDFVDDMADFTVPTPFSPTERNVETFHSGKIVDIPKGTEYIPSPFATSVPNFTASIQSVLQAVAVRWNAPPWIASGSMEQQSFASSLTAENPFVKTGERSQRFYKSRWLRTHWKAIKAFADARSGIKAGGRTWDFETVKKLIKIEVEPPRIQVRNRGEDAQVDTAYAGLKAKSPQMIAQEQGWDYEQVAADWERHNERFGEQGMPLDIGGLGFGSEEPLGGANAGQEPGNEGEVL